MAASTTGQVTLSLPPLDSKPEYYPDWCLRMKVILRSNDCLQALTTNRPELTNPDKPIEDEEELYEALLSEFERRDSKAMELIFCHLSPYALNFVREAENAKQVWQILKSNYEDKSPANQLHLFDKLLRLKMTVKEDIMAHFAKFDAIINELRASGVTAINDEQFLVSVLLRSMCTDYSIAVTAIAMTAKEELKIETVKCKLRNHSLTIETTSEPSILLMDSQRNDDSNRNKRFFRGCGRGFGLGQNRGKNRLKPYLQNHQHQNQQNQAFQHHGYSNRGNHTQRYRRPYGTQPHQDRGRHDQTSKPFNAHFNKPYISSVSFVKNLVI